MDAIVIGARANIFVVDAVMHVVLMLVGVLFAAAVAGTVIAYWRTGKAPYWPMTALALAMGIGAFVLMLSL